MKEIMKWKVLKGFFPSVITPEPHILYRSYSVATPLTHYSPFLCNLFLSFLCSLLFLSFFINIGIQLSPFSYHHCSPPHPPPPPTLNSSAKAAVFLKAGTKSYDSSLRPPHLAYIWHRSYTVNVCSMCRHIKVASDVNGGYLCLLDLERKLTLLLSAPA